MCTVDVVINMSRSVHLNMQCMKFKCYIKLWKSYSKVIKVFYIGTYSFNFNTLVKILKFKVKLNVKF